MKKNILYGVWMKILFLVVITCVGYVYYIWTLNNFENSGVFEVYLGCFYPKKNNWMELNESEIQSTAIFFHETSCHKQPVDDFGTLNARQSCSIESALRANPDMDVYLLSSTPMLNSMRTTKNTLVKQLLTYSNFKPRYINVSKYLKTTPLNEILVSGSLNKSSWPVEHSSDVLRYATLYKFGGIYLDLDVIVLKSLSRMKNFAGAETIESLGSSVLGFGSDKVGREMAAECALEISSTYKPDLWGFNGPGVITRVLEKRCKTHSVKRMIKRFCGGFTVYPPKYFSPVPFEEYEILFMRGFLDTVLTLTNSSFSVHYWNKMSSSVYILNDGRVPFIHLASQYCPKIYQTVLGDFQ